VRPSLPDGAPSGSTPPAGGIIIGKTRSWVMGLSISGLGSGFDWQSTVEQVRQVQEKQLLGPLNTQKSSYKDKLDAWDSISSKLSAFLTAVQDIKDSTDFDLFAPTLTSSSASVAADSLLAVTVDSGAGRGLFDIQVTNLAKAEKLQSDSVTSTTTDAGWTGSISVGGNAVTLDGKSLTDLQDEINTLNTGDTPTGVVASVLQVSSSDYRLLLTSEETGAAGIDFTDAAGDYFATLQAGEDAAFSIDGISMTRSSNTVDDAIAGITLNLMGEDATTTVTLDLRRDQDAMAAKVQAVVDAYNGLAGYINDQFSYNADTQSTGGPLFGDGITRSLKSTMQSALLDAGLYNYGITFENDGTVSLDGVDLEAAFQSDFGGTVSGFNDLAQSLESILSGYTDSVDGTVKLQRNSIQTNIDRLDDKITNMTSRIDMEMERLTKQFIAMDDALNQMQSQSNWLSSQLSSLGYSS